MRVQSALLLAITTMVCACGPAPPEPVTVEVPLAAATPAAPEVAGEPARRAPPKPSRPPREVSPGPAPSAAAAEALFSEARQLMARGAVAEACQRFEESLQLDPALGTILNLGACEQTLGHTARACELFHDAARMAQANGQADRERFAIDRSARLGCPP